MAKIAKLTDKGLVRWYAWRKLRFNLVIHFGLALIEWLTAILEKERVAFARITVVLLEREAEIEAAQRQTAEAEASWRHNLEIAEIMTIALGGTDLRGGK